MNFETQCKVVSVCEVFQTGRFHSSIQSTLRRTAMSKLTTYLIRQSSFAINIRLNIVREGPDGKRYPQPAPRLAGRIE